MKFTKFSFVIICWLSFSIFSNAQKKNIRFQHFTIVDGLPQNMIDCIWQDKNGFMWFGTWNGLCRFDGFHLKKYEEENKSSDKKLNNFIYSISEDDFGNLWVGTNSGLAAFLYKKSRFKHLTDQQKFNFSAPINVILKLKSQSLWVAAKDGIAEIRPENDTAEITVQRVFQFGESKNNIAGSNISCIYQTRSENIWIGTNLGISILPKNKNEFKRLLNKPGNPNSIPSNIVQAIFEDSKGLIWIGTEYGLSVYDSKSDIYTNYLHAANSENSLVNNSVTDINEDLKGNIIIGTLGGISIYNKNMPGIFKNYVSQVYSEFGLNNDFINCLHVDRRGFVWIGTEQGGINKYNPSQNEFEYFEKEVGDPNSLNWNTVSSIYEDDKYIWIGTNGGGLNRYSKLNKIFTHITHSPTNTSSISSNMINSILKDKKGNLWIGTWGGGLNKLVDENSNSPSFKRYQTDAKNANSLVNNYISSLLFDDDNNLWIGTLRGLDRYNIENDKFEHFHSDRWGLDISRVGCLAFDRKNNLWVGTRYGLFKIISENGQINISKPNLKYFKHIENSSKSLSGDYVISILFDSNGKMWIGTYGNGLNSMISEDNNGIFENFTISDGLPNNIIYSILEDNNGSLWLSTDHGLSKYDTKLGRFRNFNASDGLQNNQYYWASSYKNSKGKLYFGGMNGLNTFYPEWVEEQSVQPKVVFTDFKIFNESVKVGEIYDGKIVLKKLISETDEVEMSYKSNEFLFEFSTMDFEKSSFVEYAYMLEGFEKSWNSASSDRPFASYTNLSPGDYLFKVKATYNKGEWTQMPSTIKITIVPPFWRTWWFILIFAVFFISVFVIFYKYRIYSLKMQKRKLEFQVKERTNEIENQNIKLGKQNEEILEQRDELIKLNKKVNLANQYKLRFFTNISHEFRTPLTLILNPVEKLLKSPDQNEKSLNTLSLINRNAQRLLHLIDQLMDFRKIEKGKMELRVSQKSIVEFVTEIADAFKDLAKQKNISLSIDSEDFNKTETWFDQQKIENILYNLLSNAFKYTNDNGKIWLKIYLKNHNSAPEIINNIAMEPSDKCIVIEVGDTGVGIGTEDINHIFNRFYRTSEQHNLTSGSGIGLSLSKELIKTHKGKIRVWSKQDTGSVFYITFPIDKESYTNELVSDATYNTANLKKQVENLYNEFINEDKFKDNDYKNKLIYKKKRPTILIAEDNRDLREFLAIKLNEKFNIIEAENGKIAYDQILVHNPGIVISDIMMPLVDGVDLCKMIKKNISTCHIPIILLTAKSNIESRLEGLESGADDYISKPFNFTLLEARIENLIELRKKLFTIFTTKNELEPNEITSNPIDEKFLRKAIKLVENNIGNQEFGVSDLISELNVSQSTLYKKLIALTDKSPIDFVNSIKLKKSISQLKKRDISISEVAFAAGFNDPKYYTRLFKRFYGKTPTEFQNELIDNKPGSEN